VLLTYCLGFALATLGGVRLLLWWESKFAWSEADTELDECGVPSRDRRRYVRSLRGAGLETRAALIATKPLASELVDDHGFREGHARAFSAFLNAAAPAVYADVTTVMPEGAADDDAGAVEARLPVAAWDATAAPREAAPPPLEARPPPPPPPPPPAGGDIELAVRRGSFDSTSEDPRARAATAPAAVEPVDV